MATPTLPTLMIAIIKGEKKTIGVSFANKGPVKAGETISVPTFDIQAGSGVIVDPLQPPAILDADFVDGGTGAKISIGQGFRLRLDGTNGVPGVYNVIATVQTIGNDLLKVAGRLFVVAPKMTA
jgi:hypothetical protein